MLVRSLLIATMTLATPTLAAEQMAKSGSFITASSFKGIEQAQQTGGHTLQSRCCVWDCYRGQPTAHQNCKLPVHK